MNNTNFRICNAAIGRIFIKLIETAEKSDWDFAQLGKTMIALKGFMSNVHFSTSLELDQTTYISFCEQVNASEARSQRARERWNRKKGITVSSHVEKSVDIPVVASIAAPVTTPVEKKPTLQEPEVTPTETAPEPENVKPEVKPSDPKRIVPPGLRWAETIAVVNGRVEIPKKRPIYYDDVPRHLREIGVESYEEYLRHKFYREGLRDNDLECKICLYADRKAISRKREEEQ